MCPIEAHLLDQSLLHHPLMDPPIPHQLGPSQLLHQPLDALFPLFLQHLHVHQHHQHHQERQDLLHPPGLTDPHLLLQQHLLDQRQDSLIVRRLNNLLEPHLHPQPPHCLRPLSPLPHLTGHALHLPLLLPHHQSFLAQEPDLDPDQRLSDLLPLPSKLQNRQQRRVDGHSGRRPISQHLDQITTRDRRCIPVATRQEALSLWTCRH